METPNCKCGTNKGWVVGRKIEERQTWNPETNAFTDLELSCTELWMFCSDCGYDVDPDDEIYKLLENK